jgi:hypothetical protein
MAFGSFAKPGHGRRLLANQHWGKQVLVVRVDAHVRSNLFTTGSLRLRLWRLRALTRDWVAPTAVLSAARHYNLTMASRSFHIGSRADGRAFLRAAINSRKRIEANSLRTILLIDIFARSERGPARDAIKGERNSRVSQSAASPSPGAVRVMAWPIVSRASQTLPT